MRDGASIIIRSYQPDKMLEGGSPLIVLYHGGGFALGGLESETMTCRSISMSLGAVVCNVDYRLAPDYKFPTAAHDAWDALKWVGSELSIDSAKLLTRLDFLPQRSTQSNTFKRIHSRWYLCWW